ncbi:hypothetical protein [Streptomyces platensis]|uniref:hypothetical protein n=1 Tax=Streptomyces platensis TaxID=58346 RepID=UPI0038686DC4|nr:hypothetical protein OG962_17710 [Streptomyces platensis]
MRDFESLIPHFVTDERVASFFKVALNVEWIDEVHKGKPRGDSQYGRHLREALEYLLRERPFTAQEFDAMTSVGFWEDDRLYAYLQDLYDYFYGDRAEPPQAPDPEAHPDME